MILVIGLGNPGKEYRLDRHNIGFMTIEELRKESNSPKFKFTKKFNALVSEWISNGEKILLVQPQTFMNLSGRTVKAIAKYYNIGSDSILVVHDDIDLPLEKIRIVKNRGSGGHRGVESIIKELKTKDFIRLRIGIQSKGGKPRNVEKFVIKKFSETERKKVNRIVKETCLATRMILKGNLEKAMTQHNK